MTVSSATCKQIAFDRFVKPRAAKFVGFRHVICYDLLR